MLGLLYRGRRRWVLSLDADWLLAQKLAPGLLPSPSSPRVYLSCHPLPLPSSLQPAVWSTPAHRPSSAFMAQHHEGDVGYHLTVGDHRLRSIPNHHSKTHRLVIDLEAVHEVLDGVVRHALE